MGATEKHELIVELTSSHAAAHVRADLVSPLERADTA